MHKTHQSDAMIALTFSYTQRHIFITYNKTESRIGLIRIIEFRRPQWTEIQEKKEKKIENQERFIGEMKRMNRENRKKGTKISI